MRKKDLKGTIPATVSKSVLSSGLKDALSKYLCSLDLKKSIKLFLISLPVISPPSDLSNSI